MGSAGADVLANRRLNRLDWSSIDFTLGSFEAFGGFL
jgi:hypothetical protein